MMGLIIDYAYTRETDVMADNVERLLPAADQFHVLGLVKRCCDYLASGLDVDNCIGIRNFARTYFCNNLERITNRSVSGISDVFRISEGGSAFPFEEPRLQTQFLRILGSQNASYNNILVINVQLK